MQKRKKIFKIPKNKISAPKIFLKRPLGILSSIRTWLNGSWPQPNTNNNIKYRLTCCQRPSPWPKSASAVASLYRKFTPSISVPTSTSGALFSFGSVRLSSSRRWSTSQTSGRIAAMIVNETKKHLNFFNFYKYLHQPLRSPPCRKRAMTIFCRFRHHNVILASLIWPLVDNRCVAGFLPSTHYPKFVHRCVWSRKIYNFIEFLTFSSFLSIETKCCSLLLGVVAVWREAEC